MSVPRMISSVSSHAVMPAHKRFSQSSAMLLRRHASTTRSPTPNQFAKNASAAYAKQKQPQYQSQPREPSKPQSQSQRPAQQRPNRAIAQSAGSFDQEVGGAARPTTQGSLMYRLLTSLSSTFKFAPVSRTDPQTQPGSGNGAYSVHSPQAARSKLRSDATTTGINGAAAVRQKLGYDAVARRILFAMVAAPIAIVTSWVLYKRLAMGEGKKAFPVTPKPKHEDQPVGFVGSGVAEVMDRVES